VATTPAFLALAAVGAFLLLQRKPATSGAPAPAGARAQVGVRTGAATQYATPTQVAANLGNYVTSITKGFAPRTGIAVPVTAGPVIAKTSGDVAGLYGASGYGDAIGAGDKAALYSDAGYGDVFGAQVDQSIGAPVYDAAVSVEDFNFLA